MKITKLLIFALLLSYLVSLSVSVGSLSKSKMNTHFASFRKPVDSQKLLKDRSKYAPRNLTQDDLPDQPIYYQGWIKYFSFTNNNDSKNKKPKYFYKNEEFKKQVKAEESTQENKDKDQFGSFRIPSESSFFAVAYEDRINILKSRQTAFINVIDSLSISLINNVPDDAHFKGGIKDLGKFSEGYCFEIKTSEPVNGFWQMTEREPTPDKSSSRTWYICSDDEDTKNKFMNLIIKLRLKKQHQVGLWLRINDPPKKPTIANLITPEKEQFAYGTGTSKVKSLADGYWILLQDWSSCSKKCGGGLQYQQLMCIPPKDGGKPCDGKSLRTKPCNEQPCPDIYQAAKVLPKKDKEKMNKPIVKMMPISSRPLRYDKCHLKESDAIYTKFERGVGITDNPMKLPSRVVMNERTVSVYTDETLLTMLGTFVIEKTAFKYADGKEHCFILDSETIKAEFCNLDANSKINFVEEWRYDFSLFKNQCHTQRKVVALNDKEEKELKDELQKKIDSAKLDVIKERTKRIQQKVQDSPINKVEKLQETAMLALKKELSIDELLQKEELEREDAETRELRLKLESEKKKDECLIKSIKEKQLEDQYNVNKAQQDRELAELREEAKQQILLKRKQVKIKILRMRKRAERKKKLLNGQIQVLRTQVAGELNTWNRAGNMNLCFRPTNSENDLKKMNKYCNTSISAEASPAKINECTNKETFCYVCCENEYGDMHLKEREKCYDKCEMLPKQNKPNNGSWQWVEPVN